MAPTLMLKPGDDLVVNLSNALCHPTHTGGSVTVIDHMVVNLTIALCHPAHIDGLSTVIDSMVVP